MKRVDLIRHIEANGGLLRREGGNHSVYINPVARATSVIPRHREISDFLGRSAATWTSPSRDAEQHVAVDKRSKDCSLRSLVYERLQLNVRR